MVVSGHEGELSCSEGHKGLKDPNLTSEEGSYFTRGCQPAVQPL